jgi:hypothetical protein
MRDMVGGSYLRSLTSTFLPELLSMNVLMAAMMPTMMTLRSLLAPTAGPGAPVFWFVMSMALLVGFIAAYPMNWWLVANHLKHGMITVRPNEPAAPKQSSGMDMERRPSVQWVGAMTLVSVIALAVGAIIALRAAPM